MEVFYCLHKKWGKMALVSRAVKFYPLDRRGLPSNTTDLTCHKCNALFQCHLQSKIECISFHDCKSFSQFSGKVFPAVGIASSSTRHLQHGKMCMACFNVVIFGTRCQHCVTSDRMLTSSCISHWLSIFHQSKSI